MKAPSLAWNHTVLIARDGSKRPIDDSGPIRRVERRRGVVLVFETGRCRHAERTLERSEQTARFLLLRPADLAELTDDESTLQKLASAAVPRRLVCCGPPGRRWDHPALAVQHTDRQGGTRLNSRNGIRPGRRPTAFRRWPARKAELIEAIPDSLLTALAHDDVHLRELRALG